MDRAGASAWPPDCALILLTGGASRRLGRDKATVHVGGRPLLERLLEEVPGRVPVVVVGELPAGVTRQVVMAREDPPGSGPLAGIGAGVAAVTTSLVAVLAGDMPFAVPVVAEALARLARAGSAGAGRVGTDAAGADGVVPVDPQGFAQPLCAAYRTTALRAAVAGLGPLAGQPVRALLGDLDMIEWPVPAAALADVDTGDELRAARTRAAREGGDMQDWVDAVRGALGVEVEVDIDAILDVARDAAHAVARPAAPVTTYVMGAAVAAGADPADVAARVADLARTWPRASQ